MKRFWDSQLYMTESSLATDTPNNFLRKSLHKPKKLWIIIVPFCNARPPSPPFYFSLPLSHGPFRVFRAHNNYFNLLLPLYAPTLSLSPFLSLFHSLCFLRASFMSQPFVLIALLSFPFIFTHTVAIPFASIAVGTTLCFI